MLRAVMAISMLAFLGVMANGDDKKEAPKEAPKQAKTTADILKEVDAIKRFGTIFTAEFRNRDDQVFVVSYNPYSGAARCHVHAYRFDIDKKQWVRFLDEKFQGTHKVSVEYGTLLTIRDVKGEVVFKEKAKN